jgi:hypothetical protein
LAALLNDVGPGPWHRRGIVSTLAQNVFTFEARTSGRGVRHAMFASGLIAP